MAAMAVGMSSAVAEIATGLIAPVTRCVRGSAMMMLSVTDARRSTRRPWLSRGQYDDDYGAGGYADRGMMAGAGFGMYPSRYPYGGYIGARGSRGDALGGRGYDDRFAQRRGGNYRDREYRGREDRGFLDRAGDEVASWFGDEDAERRRRVDAGHRGRGPKNYTRTDERIREDVNDRLSDDPHIDASEIEVMVSEGEVTLNGTVSERFAKRHAEDIAEEFLELSMSRTTCG